MKRRGEGEEDNRVIEGRMDEEKETERRKKRRIISLDLDSRFHGEI